MTIEFQKAYCRKNAYRIIACDTGHDRECELYVFLIKSGDGPEEDWVFDTMESLYEECEDRFGVLQADWSDWIEADEIDFSD